MQIVAIILVAFVEQVYGEDILEGSVDTLSDELFSRALKAWSPSDMEMDGTMLAKPGALAVASSPGKALPSIPGSIMSTGIKTLTPLQPSVWMTPSISRPLPPVQAKMKLYPINPKRPKEGDDVRLMHPKLRRAKPGYIRYLMNHPDVLKEFVDKGKIMQKQKAADEAAVKAKEEAESASKLLAERLKQITLSASEKADKEGNLFGSVSAEDVVELLDTQVGIKLAEKSVNLEKPIKTLGEHLIPLTLPGNIEAGVRVRVNQPGKGDKGLTMNLGR